MSKKGRPTQNLNKDIIFNVGCMVDSTQHSKFNIKVSDHEMKLRERVQASIANLIYGQRKKAFSKIKSRNQRTI